MVEDAGPGPLYYGEGSDPNSRLAEWGADVILVAIRDDAIADFVGGLRLAEGTVVLHTSGSLPLDSIPVPRGAALGGWHPLQSFASPGPGHVPVPPYWVALDGDDRAVAVGRRLAIATGHESVVIRGSAKAAYHAAAVLASNALVALESAAARVMMAAGVPQETCWPLLRPLVLGTVDNLVSGDFAGAITGPVARGDARTVARNLEALSDVPGAEAVYCALGQEALRLVEDAIGPEDAARVRDVLRRTPPDA